MKGIILAGGTGSRLFPVTIPTVKQLLPIYDKPLIYYPLTTLLQAGVTEVLIICVSRDKDRYEELFGDGHQLGISITYAIQEEPRGLSEAFIIGENFINGENVWLVLGDNLFFGERLGETLEKISERRVGATVFAYKVKEPERYGVIEFDNRDNVISIEEKPSKPKSNYAQTGLYYFDKDVVSIAKSQIPSARGELEIVDTAKEYLKRGNLKVETLGIGFAWLDTGTCNALSDATTYVRVMTERQGVLVGSPELTAFIKGLINKDQLLALGEKMKNSEYGQYLIQFAKEF